MTPRSRWAAWIAALVVVSTGSGCRGPCANSAPALEVTVHLDAVARGAIKSLGVIVKVTPRAGGDMASWPPRTYNSDELAGKLDDGKTSFVVYPGDMARAGFFAAVTVTGYDSKGAVVARGELEEGVRTCSGDACNFANVHLKRASSPEAGPDGPRDLGDGPLPDRAADSRKKDITAPDGPPPVCTPLPMSDSALCPKKAPWVNLWPYATEITGPSQCEGPDGTTYPLIGEGSAPFFNYKDCGGKNKYYSVMPSCRVLIVAAGQCGTSCSPFQKISFWADHSLDGWDWTAGSTPYDAACSGIACAAYQDQLTVPAASAPYLRIRGNTAFKACLYQGP